MCRLRFLASVASRRVASHRIEQHCVAPHRIAPNCIASHPIQLHTTATPASASSACVPCQILFFFPDIIFYQISFIDQKTTPMAECLLLLHLFFSPVGKYSKDNCPGIQVLCIIITNTLRAAYTRELVCLSTGFAVVVLRFAWKCTRWSACLCHCI